MKSILILSAFLISIASYGQSGSSEIVVLAEQVSGGEGSKIHSTKYRIVKVLAGKVSNDTIEVGYYFYKALKDPPKYAVLSLATYEGGSLVSDDYTFPEYDQVSGTASAHVETIDFDYWEGCETGEGECEPLTFTRKPGIDRWFLMMPCAGNMGTVTLSKKMKVASGDEVIFTTAISAQECPPYFELTDLEDGRYTAYMIGCALGGTVQMRLISAEK
jgi:hypothetical protein